MPAQRPGVTILAPSLPQTFEAQVREAAYNIRAFRRLWARAARLAAAGLDRFADGHDAMGLLEFLAADDEAGEAARQAAAAAAA